MINPRHLRPFLAVAQTGSVARAAEQIHRVQSAITRSVQELETNLQVPLFERRPQGMLLTEYGRVLLARVEAIFAELASARQAFAAACRASDWHPNAPIFTLSIGRQRLLVFIALVRVCHMGAVARQFGISQSAVSLALRDVEQGLGLALLTRHPAGLAPNALGERLALHLRRAVSEMKMAEEEIVSRFRGVTGHVVVGTLSLGRNWLLPQAIIRTTAAHPNIVVSTLEADFEHLATVLRAAEIDFIVGGLRPQAEMAGLVTRPVLRAGISLVARRGHPLQALLRRKGWAALAEARWVLPNRGTWTRSSLELSLSERKLGLPRVVVETADVMITRALVLGSDMITAVSPHLYGDEIAAGAMIVLPVKPGSAPRDIGIVTRADARPTVAAQRLMDAVADAVSDARSGA